MSKLVKQTELELKEKIMDALGRAVADGVEKKRSERISTPGSPSTFICLHLLLYNSTKYK